MSDIIRCWACHPTVCCMVQPYINLLHDGICPESLYLAAGRACMIGDDMVRVALALTHRHAGVEVHNGGTLVLHACTVGIWAQHACMVHPPQDTQL